MYGKLLLYCMIVLSNLDDFRRLIRLNIDGAKNIVKTFIFFGGGKPKFKNYCAKKQAGATTKHSIETKLWRA